MTSTPSFYDVALDVLGSFDCHSSAEFGIRATFRAKIETALPLRRIVAIASALEDRAFATEDVRVGLTRMVRAGVLRRRVICGASHWEVNAR